jgi:acyl carrier protein
MLVVSHGQAWDRSLGLLKMMFFIEERFGLNLEDVDIPATFETVHQITAHVESRVAAEQPVS